MQSRHAAWNRQRRLSHSDKPCHGLHTFRRILQDQWRATQRLTITAGLRYENQRPATERFNRLTYFDTKAVNPVRDRACSPVHGVFEYANKNNRYAFGDPITSTSLRALESRTKSPISWWPEWEEGCSMPQLQRWSASISPVSTLDFFYNELDR